MQHKIFANSILKRSAGLGDRQIRVVASTATPDRVKDVMLPEGCDLTHYRSNPIVLFNHDAGKPVGNASVEIKLSRVEALITFAPAGASKHADEVCALCKAGVLSTVSIGFEPISREPIKGGGWKYTAFSLLELSIVAVPANPDAQVIERGLNLRHRAGGISAHRDKGVRTTSEVERQEEIARLKSREDGIIRDLPGPFFAHAMSRKIAGDALQRSQISFSTQSTKAQRAADVERLRKMAK